MDNSEKRIAIIRSVYSLHAVVNVISHEPSYEIFISFLSENNF
jgi:hypothetical protein